MEQNDIKKAFENARKESADISAKDKDIEEKNKSDIAKVNTENDKEEFLSDQGFQKSIETLNENPEVDQFNVLKNILLVNKIMNNENDDDYVLYIEKKRLDELEELKKIEALDEEKRTKYKEELSAYKITEQLSSQEYFLLNSVNDNVIEQYKEDRPENSKPYESELNKEIDSKVVDLIQNSAHLDNPQMTEHLAKKAALGEIFNDTFKGAAKYGLSAVSLATNPAGFFTGKVVGAAINQIMKTETGQNFSKKVNEKWEKVLGNGKKSLMAKMAVGALVTTGIVVGAVMGVEVISVDNLLDIKDQMSLDFASVDNSVLGINSLEADTANLGSNPSLSDSVAKQMNSEVSELSKGLDKTASVEPQSDGVDNVVQEVKQVKVEGSLTQTAATLLPKGSSYTEIEKLALQLAEHNGIPDPDVVPKGLVLEVPQDLPDVKIPEFEINSMEDLKNLDKIKFGTNITGDELLDQVNAALSKEYPNSPERVHEMMVAIKPSIGSAVDSNGFINTKNPLNIGEAYETYFGENKIELSSEQEYAYPDSSYNEAKRYADYEAIIDDPSKMTSDDQELAYSDSSYNLGDNKSELKDSLSKELTSNDSEVNNKSNPKKLKI